MDALRIPDLNGPVIEMKRVKFCMKPRVTFVSLWFIPPDLFHMERYENNDEPLCDRNVVSELTTFFRKNWNRFSP